MTASSTTPAASGALAGVEQAEQLAPRARPGLGSAASSATCGRPRSCWSWSWSAGTSLTSALQVSASVLPGPGAGRRRALGGPREPVAGDVDDDEGGRARHRARDVVAVVLAVAIDWSRTVRRSRIPADGRLADAADHRARAARGDLVRLRHRAEDRAGGAVHVLLDRRRHSSRGSPRRTPTRWRCCARWARAAAQLLGACALPSAMPQFFTGPEGRGHLRLRRRRSSPSTSAPSRASAST